jgi:hypothetical protein
MAAQERQKRNQNSGPKEVVAPAKEKPAKISGFVIDVARI